jgi:iron complex transport system substrate-binding protein
VSRPPRLLGASLALAALLATGACAGSGTGEEAEAATGGWSFTDDLGTTVELDARPERVAGLNDVASSL